MTDRGNANDAAHEDEERRWNEEWERLRRQARDSLRRANRRLDEADYWEAVARRERRRGLFL